MRPTRLLLPLGLSLALTACFGGGKVPPILLTLAPESAAPGDMSRSAGAGQTVTISDPVVPRALKSMRIPANVGDTSIAYIKDAQWVDMPAHLFQQLLSETVKRTTDRVVLDPAEATGTPGLQVGGSLDRFGYDAGSGMVEVRYDATLVASGSSRIETRRFDARQPSDGTKASVGPALNRAANAVAIDVARWVGTHR